MFYLLWDVIRQGKPIGAYVKNRAKDGRHYWVFAVVTPVEDGYLSVRLKPSSDVFGVVREAYKNLLAYERETKATPKESMEKLLTVLKSIGSDRYDDFMSMALRKEIEARDSALGRDITCYLQRFESLTARANAMLAETASIFAVYGENRYVPMNLQIQSAQLGEEGRAISVISGNFSIVSAEIQAELDRLSASSRDVFARIYEGQFLLYTAQIQKKVVAFFHNESGDDAAAAAQEMELLNRQLQQYQQFARNSLKQIVRTVEAFHEDCQRMKRYAASLEVIRVMGKVDTSRLHTASNGLSDLIDELGGFQTSIAQSIAKIERYSANMRSDMDGVLSAVAAG